MVNYSWIVANPTTRDVVIVDPAWEFGRITQILADNFLNLKGVLLTHHHHDHIHLADPMARAFGVEVWISRRESEFYGISGSNFKTFENGQSLGVAGLDILPILTPGHTAGSTCFKIGKALFTGDTLFNEGCGMCVGLGADPVAMFESLMRLNREVDDDVHVYPGHKYSSDLGQSWKNLKRMNVYLNIWDRNEFVAFRMRAQISKNAFSFI